MTKIETIVAKWLARRVVSQWPHKHSITEFYRILREAAADKFVEDNPASLHSFLRECFDDASDPLCCQSGFKPR